MPNGKYLIEKYHIKYTQSLTVLELITTRKYNKQRKPLLAFGGAIYNNISYNEDMIISEKQLEYLKKETYKILEKKESTRSIYNKLGLLHWNNLPGTLPEVKSIKNIRILFIGHHLYITENKFYFQINKAHLLNNFTFVIYRYINFIILKPSVTFSCNKSNS